MTAHSNLDLLQAEIEVIWGPERRAPEAPPSVVIGDAAAVGDGAGDHGTGGMIIEVRSDLDRALLPELRSIAEDHQPSLAVGLVQGQLRRWFGPLEITVGPGYDCSAPAAQATPEIGRLIRSDRPHAATALRRPPTWDDEEWPKLLSGGFGPWAMVVDGDRMLSLCHCARLAPAGVEAGTWTAEDVRGRGLAAVATAAWADACRSLPGHVFYSTDRANVASQRVAARLNLPLIGQLWKFRTADEDDGPLGERLSVIARVEYRL
ncbi:GNAT family N-acetyltransferase [Microlunatus elymi]|uniref:GNAT family N-acetyltransferase n=1 Tax=Microlunatus elymi TaxID=2596828 RepID=A0A516PTP0_9ACTN|nr:GNAT family N-acetyltransferase [Microlunatus elymi]QDP94548.1 GNAT family N-acetyltransferase [Microlunatus elymi]